MFKAANRENIGKTFYEDYVTADRLMLILLGLQWFIAAFISSQTYNTFWFGLINGGIITVIPLAMYPFYKGTRIFRTVIALSMMSFSIIYIQQHLGRIEMHFHVFVALAFLGYYKDIVPVLVGTFHTVIYHILFNYLQNNSVSLFDMPLMIFNYGCGWDIVFLHAFFALVEGLVIGYMVTKQIEHSLKLINSERMTRKLHDDVAREHETNLRLLRETRQLEVALDENSIVSRTDTKGIITYANDKFVKISGYSIEELIGKPHNIVRHPNVSKLFFKRLWREIASKKVFKATVKNRAKDGHTYYVDTTIIPMINNEGEIYEYLSVRYDISELIDTKHALAAEHAKDRFLANMSHELRTPLNAIIGFLSLAQKSPEDEKRDKFLQISLENSNQLLYLINDILDVSKIKSGKFSLDQQAFNPKISLEYLCESFKSAFLAKEISFTLESTLADRLQLFGDWHRISQILSNLLSNAVKFTPEKGRITITAEYQTGLFHCVVEDNGIGMSPEAQQRVFEAFEQADTSTTRKYGGTGLGLSISSDLAHMMMGELNVESIEGEGSRFILEIPLEKVSVDSTNSVVTDETPIKEHFTGNILVAEDNKTNQMLIKLMLEDLGLVCDIAADGLEVIQMYEQKPYQLIFMDENMPNMGGIDAMKALRKKYKNMVPIIALTANTMKGDRERFLKAGMDDFIGKPVNSSELLTLLKRYLSSK